MNTEEIKRILKELKEEVLKDPSKTAEQIRSREKSDWSEFFVNGGVLPTTNDLFDFYNENPIIPRTTLWATGGAFKIDTSKEFAIVSAEFSFQQTPGSCTGIIGNESIFESHSMSDQNELFVREAA